MGIHLSRTVYVPDYLKQGTRTRTSHFKCVFHFFYLCPTNVIKDINLTWLYRANMCDSSLDGETWLPTCGIKNFIYICGFSASSRGRALSTRNWWGILTLHKSARGTLLLCPLLLASKPLLGTLGLLWKLVCELLVLETSWCLVTFSFCDSDLSNLRGRSHALKIWCHHSSIVIDLCWPQATQHMVWGAWMRYSFVFPQGQSFDPNSPLLVSRL